jgi:hypothetical protein
MVITNLSQSRRKTYHSIFQSVVYTEVVVMEG